MNSDKNGTKSVNEESLSVFNKPFNFVFDRGDKIYLLLKSA